MYFDEEEKEKIFIERLKSVEEQDCDEEYLSFLQKFKPKKTTDDCFTPDLVYKAVKDFAIEEFGLEGCRVVRPFFPGADYKKDNYDGNCVVIDNPPFSILSEICRWYNSRNIKYFMFAPALTLFSIASGESKYYPCNVDVTYKNGAKVSTSFVTNLGQNKICASPKLYDAVKKADEETRNKTNRNIPKYRYPDALITSSSFSVFSKYGIDFSLRENEVFFVRSLRSQNGKTVYGGGFLVAEARAAEARAAEARAAEARAAEARVAEVFELSDEELFIVKNLGKDGFDFSADGLVKNQYSFDI